MHLRKNFFSVLPFHSAFALSLAVLSIPLSLLQSPHFPGLSLSYTVTVFFSFFFNLQSEI